MTPFDICRECIYLLLEQPLLGNDLKALASGFDLSESHFQKLFKQHVGLSPKQFQQSVLVQQAQPMLPNHSLLTTSEALSLSSPSRLHDAFVQIEAMSPGEFKSKGESLVLRHGQQDTVFGPMLVIMSQRGLMYLGFCSSSQGVITALQQRFPLAKWMACEHNQLLVGDPFTQAQSIRLHLPATNFQVQVWRALLHTQPGDLISYQDIAIKLGKPKGARGVGQAVGANPVAFLIPCHRVIKQSGAISGYRWGIPQKAALLAWEHGLRTP